MATSETVTFQGITYRRYPNSKKRTERVYFSPNGTEFANGRQRYHQELWKYHNGDIPDGYAVHHKDHNALNNDITNLELIERGAHQRYHLTERFKDPEYVKQHNKRLDVIRLKSHGWLKTDKGKAHLRSNAIKSFKLDKPKSFICIGCGAKATTGWSQGGKWCSRPCINRVYARRSREKKRLQSNG